MGRSRYKIYEPTHPHSSSKRKCKKQTFLKRVKDNFDLDKLSKKLEAFYEHDFKTFVGELKKKKITLSLIQQDEWEPYFQSYQTELLDLQNKIDATDKEIDTMVYELYGDSGGRIVGRGILTPTVMYAYQNMCLFDMYVVEIFKINIFVV